MAERPNCGTLTLELLWLVKKRLSNILCCLFSATVVYAYEQCLQTMGFHSNVWCEAALYLEKVSQQLMDKGVCFFFI